MTVDLTKLAGQGRAYSPSRAYTPEELNALLALESGRGLSRPVAADFIRNGITTLEAYDAAEAAKFHPKTLVEAAAEADASLKDNDFAVDVPAPVETPPAPEPAPVDVPAPEPVEDVPAEVAPAEEASAEAPAEEPVFGAVTKKGKK